MAVIIDEFKVVVDKPLTSVTPPEGPPPPTPAAELKPLDLRDLKRHIERRNLRVWAH